jgi:hypothetical protein
MMAALEHTGAVESGHRKLLRMKEPRFSARKGGVLRNSPHRVRTGGPVSPHPSKRAKKSVKVAPEDPQAIARRDMRNRTIAGHGENYEQAFLHGGGDQFWEQVQSLRKIDRTELQKRKLALGRHTLESVKWGSTLPNPPPDPFVCAFVDAIRDRHFPKRRQAQARFLGDSLGADGDVSPRRSRDICGEERRREKRELPAAEFYIHCCGKKRWTVDRLCPECKRNPFELPFLTFGVI